MQFAIVSGTVISTQKVKDLIGIHMKILLPCNENRKILGDPFVAIDSVGARPGDLVMWVGKREASMAIPGAGITNHYPVDAAVTGIIDDIS